MREPRQLYLQRSISVPAGLFRLLLLRVEVERVMHATDDDDFTLPTLSRNNDLFESKCAP